MTDTIIKSTVYGEVTDEMIDIFAELIKEWMNSDTEETTE